MIRINQIKIPIFDVGCDHETELELLKSRCAKYLRCRTGDIRKLRIAKKSVDARDKDDIKFVYTADIKLRDSVAGPSENTEREYISILSGRNIGITKREVLRIKPNEALKGLEVPVIGSGPCGLFAALALIDSGLRPLIIERGESAEERLKKTEEFFSTGVLDPESNMQFGEGGAGTFSDGKLQSGIKDRGGYVDYILRAFVRFGADESIVYDQKPHVGTDVLIRCLKSMRGYIEEHGGRYLFNTRFEGFETRDRVLSAISLRNLLNGENIRIQTGHAVLAVGHSARDTYEMLLASRVELEQKAFAAGIRIQHPQLLIDRGLYGERNLGEKRSILGSASYKLTAGSSDGRGVYSFCMCPGGYVVNSSSEPGGLCINGMSYSGRDSSAANAAIVVQITPGDYEGSSPLAGVAFQRRLERQAAVLAGGAIPYETFEEFEKGISAPSGCSSFEPMFRGRAAASDVRSILPAYMSAAITEGIRSFGKKIRDFDSAGAVIAGTEARTSSPVRILRDETGCAPGIKGLYPAGEGAGYAGGIVSAAADGIRAALRITGNQ